MDEPLELTRRWFLHLTGGTTITGLAGCIGEESADEHEDEGMDTNDDEDEHEDDAGNGDMDEDEEIDENGDRADDWATVTISDKSKTTLAVVEAEIAATDEERYTGLSDHDSLDEDEGMLFVYESEAERGFVMRDMDFPIDIIFISDGRQITTIYEAPVEDDQSDLTEYRGPAQWVLEVSRGYAADNEIDDSDYVEISEQ
jgi:uncharacterized membrane protein (UPF0127 family)